MGAALFIYLFIYLSIYFCGDETDINFWTVQIHFQFPFVLLLRVPKAREAGRRWEVFKLM